MQIRPLAIEGAFEITPRLHGDDRGLFVEWFKADHLRQEVGIDLPLAQANCSVSAAGVVRGIHYSEVPPGQAKYVTCVAGSVFDVVVDLRIGSPTFGHWDHVLLDDVDRRAVYLADGLGHAFMSLADGSTIVYACSTPYAPDVEHAVHPMDPDLGIRWPVQDARGRQLTVSLSARDAAAGTLRAAVERGTPPLPQQA